MHVSLPPYAAGLLASLARQLVELLSDGEPIGSAGTDPLEAMLEIDGPRDAPADPALRRLLPDAHTDDEEAAAEFRRYTERSLREGKVRDATVVVEKLGNVDDVIDDVEFELDRDETRAWLRCLTDLRLTLAERLEITSGDEDYWDTLEESDSRRPIYEIYSWLGYVLESLLDATR